MNKYPKGVRITHSKPTSGKFGGGYKIHYKGRSFYGYKTLKQAEKAIPKIVKQVDADFGFPLV